LYEFSASLLSKEGIHSTHKALLLRTKHNWCYDQYIWILAVKFSAAV